MIENKKARYTYQIEDTILAGIVLLGWEMKSLDNGSCDMSGSYCVVSNNNIDATSLKIIPNGEASKYEDLREDRIRRLLLTKKEIKKINQYLLVPGRTLIPLKIFRNNRGLYKMLIGFAKGKKQHDKKEAIKEKDLKRNNYI